MTKGLKNKNNIVVLGAGSIGCYLGGSLISEEINLTLIGREKLRQNFQDNGFKISNVHGSEQCYSLNDFNFSTTNESLENADFVFVTVKSGDTKEAGQILAKHLNPNAIIVSFQNGISNSQVLQQALPHHVVLKGMVPFNVVNHGNGHFHCATSGDLAIEDKNAASAQLAMWFRSAGLPTQLYADLEAVQWGKLLLNLNNAINALSGKSLVDELFDRQYRKALSLSISEGLRALKAANIKPAKVSALGPSLLPFIFRLPDWLFERVVGATLKADPSAKSSMADDLQFGRKTEIDYINGAVVELAASVGVEAPVNKAIIKLIKEAEKNKQGSPQISSGRLLAQVSAS